MPKTSANQNNNKQHGRRRNTNASKHPSKSFLCKLCNRPHPLKLCKKFLALNVTERLQVVRNHKYCINCLALDHSQGTCFSTHGCKTCKKFHHTLLHINPRLTRDVSVSPARSRSRSSSPRPSTSRSVRSHEPSSASNSPTKSISKYASLTAILRQNSIILLPTVLVKLETTKAYARCLLDSGSAISRISKRFVEKLGLTTLTLQDETICPLTLKSRFDSNSKIEGTFRVDNRLTIKTPAQSLPESYKRNFRDLFLADSKFYESAGIDAIIGVDIYPKVICEGVITKTGYPTAQSTIFGWTIYGSCSI